MRILFVLLCLLPYSSFAQFETPPASPAVTIEQQIGLTNFTLTYSRPGVKGRKVFGELIPFNEVWRTGANQNTLLSFDQAIMINEEEIEAGTYALFTIPNEESWVVILNSKTDHWGARGYEEEQDVFRAEVPARYLPQRVETFDLRWTDLTHTTAKLTLDWENTRIEIPISLKTHEQVDANIGEHLGPKASGGDYYRAARYYLDNDLDLAQAREWMERRMAIDGEQFGVMRYQALIEHELGDEEAAQATMERSLELAREAGNEHYVRMNERTLLDWNKKEAPLSAEDILRGSIAYHDPQSVWETGSFNFDLYESRPGGSYRVTEIEIDNGNGHFTLNQRRGRDLIHRFLSPERCDTGLNGSAEISEEDRDRLRLRCEDNSLYSNYYAYLWGLPMKLRDPGTIIDETAHVVDFFGNEYYEIRVTYSEEVGSDIWYFYFDPGSFALSGYRFYHDEAANDGEYILLEDEASVGPLLLPAKRYWYTHQGRRYLGSDELLNN